jgi:hypothetical protein
VTIQPTCNETVIAEQLIRKEIYHFHFLIEVIVEDRGRDYTVADNYGLLVARKEDLELQRTFWKILEASLGSRVPSLAFLIPPENVWQFEDLSVDTELQSQGLFAERFIQQHPTLAH